MLFTSHLTRYLSAVIVCISMSQVNAESSFDPKVFIKLQADIGIASGQLKHGMMQGSIEQLRMAAEAGDETANFLIAKQLYCGKDSNKDMPHSFMYLDNLIAQGSSVAPWLKGIAYFYGDQIKQEESRGIQLIEMAAIRGNPYAAHWIISHLSEKDSTQERYIWWLKFGAAHGEVDYQWQLANELLKSKTINNRKAAYYWLLEAIHATKDARALKLATEIESSIDANSTKILKDGVEKSGKFRWLNWNEDAMVVGASILPCSRHLEHPELSKLLTLTPRY